MSGSGVELKVMVPPSIGLGLLDMTTQELLDSTAGMGSTMVSIMVPPAIGVERGIGRGLLASVLTAAMKAIGVRERAMATERIISERCLGLGSGLGLGLECTRFG